MEEIQDNSQEVKKPTLLEKLKEVNGLINSGVDYFEECDKARKNYDAAYEILINLIKIDEDKVDMRGLNPELEVKRVLLFFLSTWHHIQEVQEIKPMSPKEFSEKYLGGINPFVPLKQR